MGVTLHGPAEGEGPARRYGPVDRVAVLSDVHANVPALDAVLAEPAVAAADLVVFCGDLTWGAEPELTVDLVTSLGQHAVCLRGNGERILLELARGHRAPARPREEWMVARHGPAAVDFVAGFAFTAVVEVAGLGPVRFCHGSPRSDHELVTPGTPEERVAALAAGIDERVIVSGHTHIQFDRRVGEWRSVNPGSVGLPYHEGNPGIAYWAVLGEDVSLRHTPYDVGEAIARGDRAGDPSADVITGLLMTPPTPAEIIADAEGQVFAD
jgi:predicted phosphodiesterase